MVCTARERISLKDSNKLVLCHTLYQSEVEKIVEENELLRDELKYNKLMFSFFNYEHDLLEAMRNEHFNKSVVLQMQLQQKVDESYRTKNLYSEFKSQIRD